jgi:hypothetical protein
MRAVPRPPQNGGNENRGRGNRDDRHSDAAEGAPISHPAAQPQQERSAPRSSDRNVSSQDATVPAPRTDVDASPSRGNSGSERGHGNSAPDRGNATPVRDQSNAAPVSDHGGSGNSAPRASQPEYRPASAPQQSSAPAVHSQPAHAAPAPAKGNSDSDGPGKDKKKH